MGLKVRTPLSKKKKKKKKRPIYLFYSPNPLLLGFLRFFFYKEKLGLRRSLLLQKGRRVDRSHEELVRRDETPHVSPPSRPRQWRNVRNRVQNYLDFGQVNMSRRIGLSSHVYVFQHVFTYISGTLFSNVVWSVEFSDYQWNLYFFLVFSIL